MSLYTLSGLQKTFDDRVVLDIPNLVLEEGSIYALLGANGAGKTTLLNILSFLEKPSQGSVFFQSKKVQFGVNKLRYLRRKVALVDQNPLLFSTTAHENLEFGLKIRKVPKSKRTELISKALELVGMKQFQGKMAAKLSGGETQRIALARAFVLEPKVLLCDEPTANVDSANQQVIIELLEKINAKKGITIIFTTHDNSLVLNLAQKTIHLSQGKIVKKQIENNFPAQIQKNDSGHFSCFFSNGLHLDLEPGVEDFIVDRNCIVSIDPWKILTAQNAEAFPERNCLKGKVVKIELDEMGVRFVFDVGILLTAMMTKESYGRLRILVGDEMFFSILPEDVQVVYE